MQALYVCCLLGTLSYGAHAGRGLKIKSPILKLAFDILKNETLEVDRLPEIQRQVEQNFNAVPRNSIGQVPIKSIAPALVRSYFAKENGWMIRGLEPPTLMPRTTQLHEALMLQRKAPKLAHLIKEAYDADRGLMLAEIATVIAVLERLILDETGPLMQGAFFLNSLPIDGTLNSSEFHEVLMSFMVVFRSGSARNMTDVQRHLKVKKVLGRLSPRWKNLVKWVREAETTSLTLDGHYTFDMADRVSKSLTQNFGNYQNNECVTMKERLLNISTPPGSGQVLYDTFHSQKKDPTLKLSESVEYLRSTGALDETDPTAPKVLIPNYILGPSNCIASSSYFGICCLSECERVRGAIEEVVLAPQVSPDVLMQVVGGISTSTVEAPRVLPSQLEAELRVIARRNQGIVSLHSSDYAQWLHRTFPNECPRPTARDITAEDSENLIVRGWTDAAVKIGTSCTDGCGETSNNPLWYESLWSHIDMSIDHSAHEL